MDEMCTGSSVQCAGYNVSGSAPLHTAVYKLVHDFWKNQSNAEVKVSYTAHSARTCIFSRLSFRIASGVSNLHLKENAL